MIKRILAGVGAVIVALLAGVVLLGVMRHRAGVRQAANSPVGAPPVGDFGATERLTILPLIEAAAGAPDVDTEHGVSYLVVTDEATILFDAGVTPSLLAANMAALGVSPEDVDFLVLSHPHRDHTGGVLTTRPAPDGPPVVSGLSSAAVFVPEPFYYGEEPATVTTGPAVLAEGVATSGTLPFAELFPMSIGTATSRGRCSP